MIVYIVNQVYDYEGIYMCGIFSTRELARKYMLRMVKRHPGTRRHPWKKATDDCWMRYGESVEVEEEEVQERLTRGR